MRRDGSPSAAGRALSRSPLTAEPGVSLTLPVVRSATGDRSSPAISTVRVDDGVLMVLEAIFEISDVTDRIMSYVGLDGTVAWTRCLTDDPIVLVQPTGQVPMTVGRVESEGAAPAWYPIDLDDGSLGEPYEGITERAINASLRLEETEVRTEPTVEWRFADGSWLLTGMDADGRELWTDPDAEAPFGDAPGFRIGVTDGTALVATCAERPDGDPEGCAAPGPLVAYDVDTGEQRWSIDADLAPVVADGFALARSEGGWDMIDVADGTAIAGQHWDESSTFAVAGGLDGASVFLRWLDGVLVAAHGDRLDLWLPTAFAAPTVEVSIP